MEPASVSSGFIRSPPQPPWAVADDRCRNPAWPKPPGQPDRPQPGREGTANSTPRPLRTADFDRSPVQAGGRLSEPASGILGAHGPLVKPLFEQAAKCGIVLQESINEIVILAERHELEGGCAVDRDNHRLVVTETPVTAQMCFGLTQRNDLHGDR